MNVLIQDIKELEDVSGSERNRLLMKCEDFDSHLYNSYLEGQLVDWKSQVKITNMNQAKQRLRNLEKCLKSNEDEKDKLKTELGLISKEILKYIHLFKDLKYEMDIKLNDIKNYRECIKIMIEQGQSYEDTQRNVILAD